VKVGLSYPSGFPLLNTWGDKENSKRKSGLRGKVTFGEVAFKLLEEGFSILRKHPKRKNGKPQRSQGGSGLSAPTEENRKYQGESFQRILGEKSTGLNFRSLENSPWRQWKVEKGPRKGREDLPGERGLTY